MDAAIETHRQALRRMLAALAAMAGLKEPWARPSDMPACDARPPVLPRPLYRAILRLLRPAESAARRLIIAAARGLAVPPPALPKARPAPIEPLLRRLGLAIVASPADLVAARKPAEVIRADRPPRLALFDPARRLSVTARRHAVPPHAAPRILSFGGAVPHVLPPPPSRDDPVESGRLFRRFQALAAALDDLPGEAMRFARWQARNDAALRQQRNESAAPMRQRRLWPLRCGRPPGALACREGPAGTGPQYPREIDAILAGAHALALAALERRDSS